MYRKDREVSKELAQKFEGQDIITVKNLTIRDLEKCIFPEAEKMWGLVQRFKSGDILHGFTLALAFFEPSSRTFLSFDSAMKHLGGNVIFTPGKLEEMSSVSKGESFPDTMKMLECYSHVIAMRHPQVGSAAAAAEVCTIPIISGGDGIGEHPTQALLDLFTIHAELGQIRGQTVVLVGDLKHGRTVHSLARLLTLYNDVKVICVSPEQLKFSDEMLSELKGHGMNPSVHDRLRDVLPEANVVYMTRVQKERFDNPEEYEAVKGSYVLDQATMALAKPAEQMIVMHPLPRVGEISTDLDKDPRAAYFRQMKYGLYVRMALLALVLGRI